MEKIKVNATSTEEAVQQKQPIYSSIFRRTVNFIGDHKNNHSSRSWVFNSTAAILVTTFTWCGVDNCLVGDKLDAIAALNYKTSFNAIRKDLQEGDKPTTAAINRLFENTFGYDKSLLNPVIPKYSNELAAAALKDVVRQDSNRKFTLTTAPIMYISNRYNVNEYVSTKRHGSNDIVSGVFEIVIAGMIAISTVLVNLI